MEAAKRKGIGRRSPSYQSASPATGIAAQESGKPRPISRKFRLLRTQVEPKNRRSGSRATGDTDIQMMQGEREKLIKMEDTCNQRVVGQDEAVTARRRRDPALACRLGRPQTGPYGSFLFLGNRGAAAKTELCKGLA